MLLIELHKSKATGHITPELSALMLDATNRLFRECKSKHASDDAPNMIAKAMADLCRVVLKFDSTQMVNDDRAQLWIRTIVLNSFAGFQC